MPARLFSVTLDVRFHGDSHGTITELVEADDAAQAEMKLVSEARDMLPSNRNVHPLITVELHVARPHRFEEGDKVAHIDTPTMPATVEKSTWQIDGQVAYPTYTLRDDDDHQDVVEDVLDTNDLVTYQEGR